MKKRLTRGWVVHNRGEFVRYKYDEKILRRIVAVDMVLYNGSWTEMVFCTSPSGTEYKYNMDTFVGSFVKA